MVVKILKIVWLMVKALVAQQYRDFFRPTDSEELLRRQYQEWSLYALNVCGADLAVQGRENIPKDSGRSLVVMANHQSQLDIPTLAVAMGRNLGFVAKKELSRLPIVSYWMRRIGCIYIDRDNRNEARQALATASRELMGQTIVIFPEGTRSKDGRLLPFKLGGSRLAILAGVGVLPVLIQGSRLALESRGRNRNKVPVAVRIFPVLDTAGLGDNKEGYHVVRDYVEGCWRRGLAVPRQG